MELSIIIVSYNTKEFLIKCVKSIIDTVKKVSYEIIVVDNDSKDGTSEKIFNSQFPISNEKKKFTFIQNKQNFGFSKANNIGIKQSKGRYLLFLNPDTVVYEKTIDGMVEFMDNHKDAGVSTCFVELPNGQLDDAAHRGFPTPWRAFCHFTGLSKLFPKSKIFAGYSLGWMDLSKVHEIDACAGAFMIVRREAGEEIGWWDEDFFWYGEDLDFCYRLKNGLSISSSSKERSEELRSRDGSSSRLFDNLQGRQVRTVNKKWRVYFCSDVSIRHYKGVSGGIKKYSQHLTTADEETRLRATRARFEAMKIFYKKHYEDKYPALINWLVMQGINFKLFSSKL